MRKVWLVGAALASLLMAGMASEASADSERLTTDARLRVRPGERAPTLMKLDEGTSVRVIGRQGRWLKVSVRGKIGWITRTQIEGRDRDRDADREERAEEADAPPPRAREGRSPSQPQERVKLNDQAHEVRDRSLTLAHFAGS